jgi:hypothetical protein
MNLYAPPPDIVVALSTQIRRNPTQKHPRASMMQDAAHGFLRRPLAGTPVNKAPRGGRRAAKWAVFRTLLSETERLSGDADCLIYSPTTLTGSPRRSGPPWTTGGCGSGRNSWEMGYGPRTAWGSSLPSSSRSPTSRPRFPVAPVIKIMPLVSSGRAALPRVHYIT